MSFLYISGYKFYYFDVTIFPEQTKGHTHALLISVLPDRVWCDQFNMGLNKVAHTLSQTFHKMPCGALYLFRKRIKRNVFSRCASSDEDVTPSNNSICACAALPRSALLMRPQMLIEPKPLQLCYVCTFVQV